MAMRSGALVGLDIFQPYCCEVNCSSPIPVPNALTCTMPVQLHFAWLLLAIGSVMSRFPEEEALVTHDPDCPYINPLELEFHGSSCDECNKKIPHKYYFLKCPDCNRASFTGVQHPKCLGHTPEVDWVSQEDLTHARGCTGASTKHPISIFVPGTYGVQLASQPSPTGRTHCNTHPWEESKRDPNTPTQGI
ncbi:hypothetical protein PCASD_07894 [Puccinia coronata f. sp. avenae]|uniref:Uncharacterized protein n=1 Tax=Puccinia coronata f. sp. avenae TaxID=200324 RepID=A0A2N5UQ20_9BASI|nr:hypothetical protein PCASD_07894 [Puccinia coronata f. sp. avenae]